MYSCCWSHKSACSFLLIWICICLHTMCSAFTLVSGHISTRSNLCVLPNVVCVCHAQVAVSLDLSHILTSLLWRYEAISPWPSSLILSTISRWYCCDSLISDSINDSHRQGILDLKWPLFLTLRCCTLALLNKIRLILFSTGYVSIALNFLLLYCHSRLPFGCASHHLLSTLLLC